MPIDLLRIDVTWHHCGREGCRPVTYMYESEDESYIQACSLRYWALLALSPNVNFTQLSFMTATGSAPVTTKYTQAADLVTIPQLLTASLHSWLTPLPATSNPQTYLEQRLLPGHFMISYPPALYEGPNQRQTCGILPLTAVLLQRQWQ